MRQLTLAKAGEPLEWRDVPEPRLQGAGEAIVRPVAVASCDLDQAVVRGETPWSGPFALGHEFVAEVVEIGDGVRQSKPGDVVVVPFQISCGACARCVRGLTGSCSSVQAGAMYGLAPLGGEWGGALSDLVRVPYADAMLVPSPRGIDPAAIASASDNIPDAWRAVGPYLAEQPDAPVLIVAGWGAGSIPLYAVAIAKALGASRVDYCDADRGRLELAQTLGANPIETTDVFPRRFGSYPIVVNMGPPEALAAVLRSTEPGGVCTSLAIYFKPPRLPLLEMYTVGVTFKTGRVMARATIPHVLGLVTSGRLHPELVTSDRAAWDDAGEALLSYRTKLVVTR